MCTDADEPEKIEITHRMIDAGVRLIEELSAHGHAPAFVAEEVFHAMLRATSPIQLAKYLLASLEDQEADHVFHSKARPIGGAPR